MTKDENGYIVVETIGTFIPFVLLVVSILSIVNIVALQARIHYALTQAANTVSMYSYTLEVLGVANGLTTLSNKAERYPEDTNIFRASLDAVLTGIESLSESRGAWSGGGIEEQFHSAAEQVVGYPKEVLQNFLNYNLSNLRGMAFEQLARPLVGRYLANGDMSGDEYLKRAGVVKRGTGKAGLETLDFFDAGNAGAGNSILIDGNGNIKLVVHYEVEYRFGGLRLPFDPTIKITQAVVTKAWLNGSGKGYK